MNLVAPVTLLFAVLIASAADAEVLDPAELAALQASARADLEAAAGRPGTGEAADRAFERAWIETDPERREAMLSAWLRDWIGPEPGFPVPSGRLERLLDLPPTVRTLHPDHPGRSHPAFNVAMLARNRIAEQQLRTLAERWTDRPDAITTGLAAPPNGQEFRAALRALTRSAPAARDEVLDTLQNRLAKGARPDHVQLALVDKGLLGPDTLDALIDRAEPRVALAAFREAVRGASPGPVSLLRRALDRPELGGLPVHHAARSSDASLRARVWGLLDEPERGADAALALAETAPGLEARIDRRFDAASERARLRMLLALHLRDSAASRRLLKALHEDRLTADESALVERWQ
ncbi:hypothetical protein HFP89_01335 [Wenzhouxiangella sp. XN79A]|uniref:hypothetical protein n=1 Tax=Wenzhouxiangella sp. XN79A TaxID=2724193 RepID=UPI00144ACDD7|nr:hypothetical protein [Wenzhouxiangella sp. XN79A]NKI33806.1 hypothetical protein [Wenzhouxiangella sp. XN79A]